MPVARKAAVDTLPQGRGALRFDQLDAWRGFGVTLVILLHCRLWITGWGAGYGLHSPGWLTALPVNLADCGLILFFSVSGFLITGNSIRRAGSLGNLAPLAFYRSRFARIAPFLLLLLAVLTLLQLLHVPSFVINPRGETSASLPSALISVLTLRFNGYTASHGAVPMAWTVLWTLSVEEVFYLFFPLVCVLTYKIARGSWLLISVLLAFVAMGPLARNVWNHSPMMQRQSYLSCMDAIAFGCLTAMLVSYVIRRGIVPAKSRLIAIEIAANVVVLIALFCPEPLLAKVRLLWLLHVMLTGGICAVAFSTVLLARPGGAISAPLRFFGRYVYEAYLTHAIVLSAVFWTYIYVRRGPLTLWIIVAILLTVAVSWACANFYSEPLNRRLRHAKRTPAQNVTVAGAELAPHAGGLQST